MVGETNEGTTEVGTEGQDSSVISAIRQENRDLQAKVKALESQAEQAAAAARATAESVLIQAGYPKLTDVVLEKVDGFPTEDSVRSVLADLGLGEPQTSPEGEEQPEPAQASPEQAVPAGASDLGQRVASAAAGNEFQTLAAQLEAATTPEEIAALADQLVAPIQG